MPPQFQSVGGAAGNAIQQFLMQREMQNRQRMLDQFRREQEANAVAEANADRGLRERDLSFRQQQAQGDAAAAARRADIENASGMVDVLGAGDLLTEDQAALMERTPMAPLVERRMTLPSQSGGFAVGAPGAPMQMRPDGTEMDAGEAGPVLDMPRQMDAGGVPGVIAFRGTAAQRATAQAANRRADYLRDPNTPEPVRRFAGAQDAGLDGVGMDDLETPEERNARLAADDTRAIGRAVTIANRTRVPEKEDKQWVADPAGNQHFRVPIDGDKKLDKAEAPSGPSPYAAERMGRVRASISELKTQVGPKTVGYGSLLAGMPETKARAFKGQVNTLKANIAFNELTQMREASKTGGALGNVALRELELLESALGSLDTGMDADSFTAQLDKIDASVARWQQAQATPKNGGPGDETDGAAARAAEFLKNRGRNGR